MKSKDLSYTISEPLKTERLILRPFRLDDAAAVHAYQSLPEVARYQLWQPRSLEEIEKAIVNWVTLDRLSGEGTLELVVETQEGGTLIGDVMLQVTDAAARQGMVGFSMHPDHQGRGYATEAVRMLLHIGFAELDLHRIFARCDARNRPSWRLMERLGMRREAHFREHALFKGGWDEEFYYALLQREWRKQPDAAPVKGASNADV